MSFLLHRGFGTKALQTVRNLANRLRASFLRSNLYKKPSSAEETLPKELLATRIYVCLLVVFMTIITIAAASMPRTVNRVVYSPSYTHFSELTYKYPNTLYCSCTKIGITYETFVNVHVRFHQVCSSPFIQQAWIDNVFAEQNLSALPLYDFRTTLSSFWQVIADLCDISNQTWTDTMLSFGASQIFNPIAMAEKNTRVETEAAIDYHVNVVRTKLNRDLLALRRTTTGNQFVSALATNFYLHYPPDFLYPWSSLKMSPRTFDNCSCLNFQGCPHPATFIDNQGNLVRVRGMIADCLVIDGTLRSTLECYYNQTCFSRLHPSSSSSMAIEPLSNGLNKYFTINSTIEMMLNNYMLIDEMTIEIRFDSYYSQCNPTYCAYSYTHRFDVLFIITIIIGIFGGLSFVLKLLASVIATIVLRWKNKAIGNNNVVQIQTNSTYQNKLHMVLHYLRLLPIYIRDEIVNLNLFESYDPRTPTNIFREQVLTRCFILMLMISFAATGFYVFLVNENQEVTIEKPSLATYLQLYDNHADTLQCPCSRLSVPYRNFLNVTNVFHEVCSSSLVSSIWLNYLSSFDPIVVPSWGESNYVRDFRTIGNSYFQLLAIFCSLAENSVDNAHLAFMNTPFINNYVLAPELFNQQTQTIIESYINNTRNEFTLTMNYIKMSFTTSYFLTGVNTNANITVTNNNQLIVKDFKYRTALITPQGISFIDTCYCATFSFYCTIHTFIYIDHDRPDYEQDLSELPTGCIPLTGFLMSKISWWFNTTSLKDIQTTYSMVIDSQPSPNIQPLNTSMTKKRKNLYLSTLISDMFIESWTTNGTYYNRFYDSCSPASCSYTIIQRRNIVITLLVFISVCSGIMRTLQIFLPFLFQLVFFFINWWKNRVNHQRK